MYGVGRSVPKGPHTDMVKMLVENGADVNSRDAIGRTPLMVAAAQPEGVDLCRLLIEHGARIDAADAQGGHTVLHWAAVSSIHRGPLDTVIYLIDRGVDIDATNHTGKTALSYAVLWDDLDLADALLDLGADPNTGAWCERPIVISGGTLLYTSNPSGMIPPAGSDMVKLLAEYGATNVAEGLPAKE
jgi:ankyrin repeat protein